MTRAPLTPLEFQRLTDVSRETLERLQVYEAALVKWQKAINLVSRESLRDPWRRHFLDSAQLFRLLPPATQIVVDLGSGAGFPGLVLAAMGAPEVHLVEADSRKCAFLRETARQLGLAVMVHNNRIEAMPPLRADAVTARALSELNSLLDLAERFLVPHTICLFLKGSGVDQELTRAQETWNMAVMRHTSASDPSGTILRLEHVHREPAS